MTRILALVLGLAIAGWAFFVIATGERGVLQEVQRPLDEIDDDSRAALERLLEEVDR